MSLQGKVVTIRKRAREMSDPKPQLVSIVEGGSNNTPIRAMKADNIEGIDMAKNLKRGSVSIARFAFDGTAFKTEDSVKEWLSKGGYDIPEVTTVKGDNFNGFMVASKEQPEVVHDIDLGNGVTAFVAVGVKEEDLKDPRAEITAVNGEATSEPTTGAQAAKDAETTEATAEATDTASSTQAAKEEASADAPADPGAPPAMISIDDKGIPSLVAQKSVMDIRDLADLLQALGWMKSNIDYQTYNGTYTPEIASAYRALLEQLGSLMMSVASATVAEATKGEETPSTEAATAAEVTEAAAPAAEGGDATGESNATSQEPAAKTEMQQLKELVGSLVTAVSGLKETVVQTASKADDAIKQVQELSGTAPSRKSADVEDIAASNSNSKPAEKSENDKFRDQQSRSLLGMR